MAAAKDFWFRPKRQGYGAEPSNWKGWVAVLGYIAVVGAITWPRMIEPALDGVELTVSDVAVWAAMITAATLAFIWLCWAKTEGDWRWPWGQRD